MELDLEQWGYSMPWDTRTVYDLAKERGWSKPEGTQAVHTSLEDCRRQIICLMSPLNVLLGRPRHPPTSPRPEGGAGTPELSRAVCVGLNELLGRNARTE